MRHILKILFLLLSQEKNIGLKPDHRSTKREKGRYLYGGSWLTSRAVGTSRNRMQYREGTTSPFRDLIKLRSRVDQYVSAPLGDGVTCLDQAEEAVAPISRTSSDTYQATRRQACCLNVILETSSDCSPC